MNTNVATKMNIHLARAKKVQEVTHHRADRWHLTESLDDIITAWSVL